MAQIKQNKIKVFKVKAVLAAAILALFSQVMLAEAKENDITPANVIKLVNNARKEAGLEALTENSKLKSAASQKAQDMIKNDYFAHVSPTGKTPWDFILEQKYDYRFAGENLAIDYTSAAEQQAAWMESPTHRQNILNNDYKEIGVAVASGTIEGRKTTVTVQEFGAQNTVIQNKINNTQDKMLTPQKAVAGLNIQVKPSESNVDNTVGKYTDFKAEAQKQIKLGQIFENNKLTLFGWFGAISLAFLMTALDAAMVIYRKHKHV